MTWIAAEDERLGVFAPQSVRRSGGELRVHRFPARVAEVLREQLGPLANLRSASGCALEWCCDSPWIEVEIRRLRHHQPIGQCLDCAVEDAMGRWQVCGSVDLRPREGDTTVWMATGLVRGAGLRRVRLWLPTLSTMSIAGVRLAEGAQWAASRIDPADMLAIGDSLTQGYNVPHPTQTWVAEVAAAQGLRAWNLGLGGLKIEPEVVDWAIARGDWRLVTVALGSNHAWRVRDVDTVAERAETLCQQLEILDADTRVLWMLPPWKPLEGGHGPREYMGVPLDDAAARNLERIRATLRTVLRAHPRIDILADCLPQQPRWMADGLHPEALGMRAYADAVLAHRRQ